MSCTTVIQRESSVIVTRPECGQRTIVRAAAKTTVVASQPPRPAVVALRGVRGLPGFDVELQKTATHVQWRLNKDGAAWQDLIAIADLVGPPSMADAPTDGTPYARKDGAWAAAIAASEKGAANGVATLVSGKIPESQIPAVAITDVFTVASQAAMLALTAERGDIAVRSDINKSFSLAAEPASTLANWIELRTPTDAVLSVAGKTGAVTLAKADVGLSNVDNTTDANKPVSTATQTALDGKAPINATLTDAAASSTLPATTSTALTAQLQTVRNCLKWLLANTLQLTGAQTAAGVKIFSSRSSHAGAYTPSLTPAHSDTPTFDCAASNSFEPGVMTSNVTSLTMSNPVAGQTVQIIRKQDATGGRTHAVPSGAKIDGSINTGANRVSILVMTYYGAGSMWIGNWLQVPA